MSTFTDDDLLNNATRLMSTKVRFFLERRQETHDALTTKKINRVDTVVILRDLRNKN